MSPVARRAAIALANAEKPLAAGRADAQGRFAIRVCRTSAVERYAGRHGAHVNLDVLAHAYGHRSRLVVRTVAPRLSAPRVTVPARFVAMAEVSPHENARSDASAGSGTIQTGDSVTHAAVVRPPVMYLENVPGITTTYSLDSSDMKSVATTVGVSGAGYGISGSIEIATGHGFFHDGILSGRKGDSQVAALIEPEVRATMTYTCRTYKLFGITIFDRSCTSAMDAAWTGDVTAARAAYIPCSQGVADVRTISTRSTLDVGARDGTTFTAKGGFDTPFVQADVSTTYSAGTNFKYTLNRSKTPHRFCVSGDQATLPDSDRIYISPTLGAGPTRCRRTSIPAETC